MKSKRPDYRLRFAASLLSIYLPPLLATLLLLRISGLKYTILPKVLTLALWPFIRIVYFRWRHARQARQLGARAIPCVRGRWVGNLDILLRVMRRPPRGYSMQRLEDLFEEYGCTTVNTRVLWQDQIISIDDGHISCALASKFEQFEKGYLFSERQETFLGNGIFNRDGEEWQMHRATNRPFFARERISDFNIFETHAEQALSIIDSRAAAHLALDIQDLALRFTMDAATEFLFGQNSDTLSRRLPEPGKAKLGVKGSLAAGDDDDDFGRFVQAFETIQVAVGVRFMVGDIWPVFEMFKDKTKEPARNIRAWTRPIVERALSMKHDDSDKSWSFRDATFLGHLVDSLDDVEEIQFQLLNILLAARDTTAGLLTFVFYFLCMHPDVTARLREEVLAACGNDGKPSAQTIRDMKYMRAVLNETLRIFPPVALTVRASKAPVALPDASGGTPLFMPAGAQFMSLISGLHRRKDLWGADSDDFRPERWFDKDLAAALSSNPGMYIPFLAGPRICQGQQFAYNEASYFLTKILQKYDKFELTPEYQPAGSSTPEEWKQGKGRQAIERCWPAQAFTTYAKGGLWLRATPAAS